jgi:hypothetical protein
LGFFVEASLGIVGTVEVVLDPDPPAVDFDFDFA